MLKITFNITGMHCASCSVRNEKSLSKLVGVKLANVNLALNTATVTYDELVIKPEQLYQAVRDNGYNVVIESVEHNTNNQHNNHVGFATTNEVAGALKKVWWAHGLTAPVLVVEMFGLSITIPLMAGLSILEWLVVIFSTVVILIIGWQFHRGMWQQLTHGTANMDSLISVGTLAAWGLSMWELLNGGARYFETGAVIVALILLGKYLEAKSRGQASEAIRKLMEYGAKQARVVRNEVE
ncbi:MAG: cation transporter, partial [Patescibacteria group bacterium]